MADKAEKVAKTGITRDYSKYIYYVKKGGIWRSPRKRPGVKAKGRSEKVIDGGIKQDNRYLYFVDKNGDISRKKLRVGGQKRKAKKRRK